MNRLRSLFAAAIALVAALPALASAHEVYVLDTATIMRDIANPSPNPLVMIVQQPHLFVFWAIVGGILVSTVFAMSITHWFETTFNPMLNRLKRWAAPIARVTLGSCLIASAYHGALFGPELPFSDFGAFGAVISLSLYASGVLILAGLFTRAAGALALLVFIASVARYEAYMLTYANYLGEIAFVMILGGGRLTLDSLIGIRATSGIHHLVAEFTGTTIRQDFFP